MKNWNYNIGKAIEWWTEDRQAYQFIVGFSAFLGFLLGVLGLAWLELIYVFLLN